MRRREILQLAAAMIVLPGKSMIGSGDPVIAATPVGVSQTAFLGEQAASVPTVPFHPTPFDRNGVRHP